MTQRISSKALCVVVIAALSSLLFATTATASTDARNFSEAGPAAHAAKKKKCKKGKKSAAAAKKCKKKKKANPPVVIPPAPPTPAPLTASEVIQRVTERAELYCAADLDCVDYGYYFDDDPSNPACEEKSTYKWVCYGYNDEDWEEPFDGDADSTCDFREIVERDGLTGIKSQQDPTYGWDCYPIPL